jgi:hypothetical protein
MIGFFLIEVVHLLSVFFRPPGQSGGQLIDSDVSKDLANTQMRKS